MRRLACSSSWQRHVLISPTLTRPGSTFIPPSSPNNDRSHQPLQHHNHSYHSTTLNNASSQTATTPCPFSTLKIDRKTKYSDAKKSFLRIAMANHPDTFEKDATEREKKTRTARFQNARIALEALVPDEESGLCVLKSEVEQWEDSEHVPDSEFDEWFENETGLSNPFDMDPATMREIAQFTEESGSVGLDRDGGMWTLARMVAAKVNEAKESGEPVENILKLEAGKDTGDENNEGRVRRRRRRSGRGGFNEGRR